MKNITQFYSMKNLFITMLMVIGLHTFSFSQGTYYESDYWHYFTQQSGSIYIGGTSSQWAHIYTNMPKFIFNQPVYLSGGFLSSYQDIDLQLQTWGTTRLFIRNSDGNVGIGTATPQAKLHIKTATSNILFFERSGVNLFGFEIGSPSVFGLYDYTNGQYKWRTTDGDVFLVETSGSVGIGTTTPAHKLELYDETTTPLYFGIYNKSQFSSSGIVLGVDDDYDSSTEMVHSGATNAFSIRNIGDPDSKMEFVVRNTSGDQVSALNIEASGNVGIGTPSPDSKLTVKGIIHAEEVKIDLAVPGPDYVFEENYPLRSLTETKTYIDQHKHLPGIPSSAEMQQNGVNLLEMNMKLLEKVEELTLYLIEQQTEIKTLKGEMHKLKSEIK